MAGDGRPARRDLRSALRSPAARHLDLGRCGRPADPPGSCARPLGIQPRLIGRRTSHPAARYDEVAQGSIDHALRFTAPCTGRAFVYPARHDAPSCRGADRPPMGLRVRLKASVDVSHLPHQARIVAEALKRYGLILADNGAPWYISGAPDPGWNNDDLHQLDELSGRDFEVVDTSSLPRPGL